MKVKYVPFPDSGEKWAPPTFHSIESLLWIDSERTILRNNHPSQTKLELAPTLGHHVEKVEIRRPLVNLEVLHGLVDAPAKDSGLDDQLAPGYQCWRGFPSSRWAIKPRSLHLQGPDIHLQEHLLSHLNIYLLQWQKLSFKALSFGEGCSEYSNYEK